MPEHDLRSARPPETVVVLIAGTASIMPGWLLHQYAQVVHQAVADTTDLFERIAEDRQR